MSSRKIINRLAILALLSGLAAFAQGGERQVLKDHLPAEVKELKPSGRLPGPKRLDLIIGLPLRNQEQLDEWLEQIYDPASANYHQYLTPEQFAERFSPTEHHYQKVINFARSHGLTVIGTHPNRTLVDVNGPVEKIERAFHVNLRLYQHPIEARTFHAPDAEPSLDLDVPILRIGGLNNYVLPRPMNLKAKPLLQTSKGMPYAAGSGPIETFVGNDFRAAYAPGVLQTGSGEAVGLFELDGYYASDIAAYTSLAGLPDVPLTNVLVNGFDGSPRENNVEVALDIDMAIAMAPGLSRIIIYEGFFPNDVLNRMATDNQARQLSSSWGFGESVDPVRQQIFKQFAAQGQSMFQAAGDVGAWPGPIYPPSDDPWVTVVGGTTLTTSDSGGAWLSETAWPLGGGGISRVYPIPSWQQGIIMSNNQGSVVMRNIPDVACMAEANVFLIANNGEFLISGGTSAAAPLWAGFAALANQQAAATGSPHVGFLNPAIYSIGKEISYRSSFHDITTGNNTNFDSANKFFATSGYDLCTGWGTPTGSNLISALVDPPNALRITPAAGITFSGPVGGPIIPTGQVYTLTNAGTLPLTWSLVNTSAWLNPSSGNGALTPRGPAFNLTVSPALSANFLALGTYSATVWFTNSNDQSWQSRKFSLAIVSPPVITSQPTSRTVMEGAAVTFSVGTSSNALLFFQWRKDNGAFLTNLSDSDHIFGTTSSTLTLSYVTADDIGTYSVIVSNVAGTIVSSNASLSLVPSRPIITVPPNDQTLLPGETLNLHVEVTGARPLIYQWKKGGTNLSDIGNVFGTTTSTLTIQKISPADAGHYSVVVSNTLGSVTSTAAVVTVDSLAAPGTTMVTLYSFSGGTDGGGPNGLARAANNQFYGTTTGGGSNFSGTIFQLSTTGPLTPLYSFTGGEDGANPFAPLLQGVDGNFYGTTFQGGAYDLGTVFRMTPVGAVTALVSLNITNGDLPYAGLALGRDGNAYGTTYKGGFSFGTLFKVATNGLLSTLYVFGGGSDGAYAYAGVTYGADDNLYGTTFKGGQYNLGTVFRATTNGFLTTLVSFNDTNGSFPYAGLAQDSNGNLYGTTSGGGAYGGGTIFRMTPAGGFTNLYSFTGASDGANPAGTLLAASDGNFYGSTVSGGTYNKGTIFRIAPNGSFITLNQFDGFDGANPSAALVEGANGSLYGTTPNGGDYGQGTIFRLGFSGPAQITSQPVNQSVFAGANVSLSVSASGSVPLFYQWRMHGTNLVDGGNRSGSSSRVLTITTVTPFNAGLYSVRVGNSLRMTQSAEAALSVTVSPPIITTQPTNQTPAPGETATFLVTATGNLPLSYQWKTNGVDLIDGGNISGSRSSVLSITSVTEANNALYSVIVSNALGSVPSMEALLSVVPISLPGTRFSALHWFTGADGRIPNGLVRATNGLLSGTTQFGGSHLGGAVFSITTNGLLTTLGSFSNTNGYLPLGPLIQAIDGNFYGTTRFGGIPGYGTIFGLSGGSAPVSLYSFTGEVDGGNPMVGLLQGSDGNFYGASTGVSDSFGKLFRLTPGGLFSNVHSFTGGIDGDVLAGELVQGVDGNFYGLTTAGGVYGNGTVFKLTPNGALTTIYSFTGGTDGYAPVGALVQAKDGNLYGVTKHNKISIFQFYGTFFKITTNGVLTTLYPLNYGDGSYPSAGLMESTDGNFYGTTEFGGFYGNGTVFRLSPKGIFTKLVDLDGLDLGSHPRAALVQGGDGSLYGTTTSDGPGGKGTIFRLSMTGAPQITSEPTNQTAIVGTSSSFSVAVFAAPPIYYQWQKNGTNLTDDAYLFGSRSRILTRTNIRSADAGTYSVVVSNALGSVISAGAVLIVAPYPMFQTVSKSNGLINLSWSAAEGTRYQVKFRTHLATGDWINLGGVITASNNPARLSDALGSNSQRFYRVFLLP